MMTNGPLRAFRSRDYSLYWVGSVLSIASHLMFFILRGWLALEMTDSAFMVTAVATSGELPQVILSMPGGVLADRMSRKAILIIAEIVTAAILATFAILISADQMNVWYLFGLTWLLGSVFSLGIPARGAIVPNLVRREDIPNGIALASIMFSGGMLVGPAVAGWLLATQGAAAGFLAAAATSAFSIVWLIPVRTGQVRRAVDRSIGSAWADTVEGMAYVVRHRVILGL
ncbi:MAG: MFS transporter, partial [Chloroflexi bacterium]|nr:MFS transporter [Chloroflexota bacterium]